MKTRKPIRKLAGIIAVLMMILCGQTAVYAGSCDVVKDGLVACYPFNGNANDESGNGNSGTVNGATLTTDRFGNANSAYSFDGKSWIDFGTGNSLNIIDSLTITAWVKTTDDFGAILAKFGDNCLYYDAPQQYYLILNQKQMYSGVNASSGQDNSYYANSMISDGNWHFLVMSVDKSLNKLTFYRDSIPDGSYTLQGSYITPKPNTPLWMGILDKLNNYGWYIGVIDDARIYNRALSDVEIKTLYQGTAATSYTISGSVKTLAGAGLSGVTMKLSTGPTATTDSSGNYSFSNIAAGSGGTITPSRSGLSFTPASQSFSNISANQTLNFIGSVPVTQYTAVFQAGAGGYISSGISSQTVNSGSSTSPVTATANSGYTFVNWKDNGGNIVSTSATLSAQTITANKIYTAYFQANAFVYYTISGYVRTASGAAISGVALMPNTGSSATSDINGYYSLSVVSGWTGKVTPSKSGYTFSSSLSYGNVTSSQTNQNYVGAVNTPTSYTISGSVKDSNNTGVSGVTMTFANSGGTASSDSTGFYSNSVSAGWSGMLTPSKTGCTFTPSSQSFGSITANQSQNFKADCGVPQGWITRSLPASYMPGVAFTVSNQVKINSNFASF